jgi:hypothetical protein
MIAFARTPIAMGSSYDGLSVPHEIRGMAEQRSTE